MLYNNIYTLSEVDYRYKYYIVCINLLLLFNMLNIVTFLLKLEEIHYNNTVFTPEFR
jgi:hypothetical protein